MSGGDAQGRVPLAYVPPSECRAWAPRVTAELYYQSSAGSHVASRSSLLWHNPSIAQGVLWPDLGRP